MARFRGSNSSHLLQQQQHHRNQHYSHPLINVPSTRPPQIPPMPRTTSTMIRKTLVHPGLTCDAACRKKTKHYRALLDDYLNCIGKDWDMPSLRMNHQTGICAFQYRNFVICIEVPVESACFFLYTCVLLLDTSTATTTTRKNPTTTTTTTGYAVVMRRALELNYLTQTTRGCTLSMDPTTKDDEGEALELTLSYSQPILGLAKGEFCTIVVNFLDTAQRLQQQLLLCCPEEEERVEQQQRQQESSSSLISSSACSSSSCFVPSTSDGDCESSAYSLLTPTPQLPPSTKQQQHNESQSSPIASSRRKTFMNRPTSSPGIAESHVPRFLNVGIVARKSCDTFVGRHVNARRADDSTTTILQEEEDEKITLEGGPPPSPPAVYRTRCANDVELPAGQIRLLRNVFTKTTKALHWTRKSEAPRNNPAAVARSSTPKAHDLPNQKEESSRSCRRPEGSPRPRTEAPGGPTKRFAYPPSVLFLAKMEQGSIRT
jgi:hypothetical protein